MKKTILLKSIIMLFCIHFYNVYLASSTPPVPLITPPDYLNQTTDLNEQTKKTVTPPADPIKTEDVEKKPIISDSPPALPEMPKALTPILVNETSPPLEQKNITETEVVQSKPPKLAPEKDKVITPPVDPVKTEDVKKEPIISDSPPALPTNPSSQEVLTPTLDTKSEPSLEQKNITETEVILSKPPKLAPDEEKIKTPPIDPVITEETEKPTESEPTSSTQQDPSSPATTADTKTPSTDQTPIKTETTTDSYYFNYSQEPAYDPNLAGSSFASNPWANNFSNEPIKKPTIPDQSTEKLPTPNQTATTIPKTPSSAPSYVPVAPPAPKSPIVSTSPVPPIPITPTQKILDLPKPTPPVTPVSSAPVSTPTLTPTPIAAPPTTPILPIATPPASTMPSPPTEGSASPFGQFPFSSSLPPAVPFTGTPIPSSPIQSPVVSTPNIPNPPKVPPAIVPKPGIIPAPTPAPVTYDPTSFKPTITDDADTTGISTVELEDPQGNWLLKRLWWERSEDRYEKVKQVVDQIWSARMKFFEDRTKLDKNIVDPFYRTAGMGQGEISEIITDIIQRLEKIRKEEGTIDEAERTLLNDMQTEKKTLQQLQSSIQVIVKLDDDLDKALSRLMEQVNRAREYERDAWKTLKDIAKVLNDKKAQEMFYSLETLWKNVKDINRYINAEFTKHFNELSKKITTESNRIQTTITTLKQKGISLKDRADKLEEIDIQKQTGIIREKVIKEQEAKEEQDIKQRTLPEEKKTNWVAWLYDTTTYLRSTLFYPFTWFWRFLTGTKVIAIEESEQDRLQKNQEEIKEEIVIDEIAPPDPVSSE